MLCFDFHFKQNDDVGSPNTGSIQIWHTIARCKQKSTKSIPSAEFLNIKVGGIYDFHCILNSVEPRPRHTSTCWNSKQTKKTEEGSGEIKKEAIKHPSFSSYIHKKAGFISTFKSLHKARPTRQKVIRCAGILIPQRICHGHFKPSPHPVAYTEEGEDRRDYEPKFQFKIQMKLPNAICGPDLKLHMWE